MQLSKSLYQRAIKHIPGGVNSPVRAFNGVGGTPVFMARGQGAYLYDVDGKEYIDYIGSWGPMILGHSHPAVITAVEKAIKNGLSFGTPTAVEVEMADLITQMMPNIDMVRMVNSGTEATMTAVRLARGITGRDKYIKFAGCYHGHSDSMLVEAGSGVLTLGIPGSPGVPAGTVADTLTATFNDLPSVARLIDSYSGQIAAIIIEPIAGNMGFIPPEPGFLIGLRNLCNQENILLIFDEVMTGFRVHPQGAQGLYQINSDITTFGKIIGGGMPVGAIAGPEHIMRYLAPSGPIYQAGTLSGNPIAMAAGLATLKQLQTKNFYTQLATNTEYLIQGLKTAASNTPFYANQVCGMFGFFFTDLPKVTNFTEVKQTNIKHFQKFFHGMLAEGIYLAPSAFEAGFISIMHDKAVIDRTIEAARKVMAAL